MSNILIFRASARPGRRPARQAGDEGCILFFTGVRYEREGAGEPPARAEAPETEAAERLKRKTAASKRAASPKTRSIKKVRKTRPKHAIERAGRTTGKVSGKNAGKRRA